MAWYNDPHIVRQLPLQYRGYALYRRHVGKRVHGKLGRGFFLLKASVQLAKILRHKSPASIELNETIFLVDLCDRRISRVLNEIQGTNREAKVIRSSLQLGDTFIDVGANHGVYSLMARHIVGSSGRVVAVEPQPQLAALLRESFQANHFLNCEVHQFACSDCEGTAKLYVPSQAGSGQAGLYENYSAAFACHEINVRTAKFDEAVAWRNFPGRIFLKLDIEGSEHSFLLGAQEMIRERQPTIIFELNPESAQAANHPVQETLELLRQLGYERFSEIDAYPHAVPVERVDCASPRNLVALASTGAEKN